MFAGAALLQPPDCAGDHSRVELRHRDQRADHVALGCVHRRQLVDSGAQALDCVGLADWRNIRSDPARLEQVLAECVKQPRTRAEHHVDGRACDVGRPRDPVRC